MRNTFSTFSWDFDKIINFSADLTWEYKVQYSVYLKNEMKNDPYWNEEKNVAQFPQFDLYTSTVLWFCDLLELPIQLKYLQHILVCTEMCIEELKIEFKRRIDIEKGERAIELRKNYLEETGLNEDELSDEAREQVDSIIQQDVEDEYEGWHYQLGHSVRFDLDAIHWQINAVEKIIARGDCPAFDYNFKRVAEFAERLPLEEAVKYLDILVETYVPPDPSSMSMDEKCQELNDFINITYLRDSKHGELHFAGANGNKAISANHQISSRIEWLFHRNDLIFLLNELIACKAIQLDYATFITDFVWYHDKPHVERNVEVGRIKQALQDLYNTPKYPTPRFKTFIQHLYNRYAS